MITLITGLPGAGKTLYTLWFIKRLAELEGRPVFYAGIKGLTLPWSMIDAQKWTDLPTGAILVIDEAQDVFEPMANGAKRPEFYKMLAKHRHEGIDIFLLTQGPKLIDMFVRELVGRHFHVVRRFGFERARIYEWPLANSTPQAASSQKMAIPIKFAYPKEVYGYYKSAELHTVKRAIPAKVLLVGLFIVSMVGVALYSFQRYQGRDVGADARSSDKPVGSSSLVAPVASAGSSSLDPLEDARRFVFASTPRVIGLPHTAPKYDEITKPVRAPIPAACVAVGSEGSEKGLRCKCYTQQGTPMQVQYQMCLDIAKNGFFQDFDADPKRDRGSESVAPVARASSSAVSFGAGAAVTVIPDLAEAPVGKGGKGGRG